MTKLRCEEIARSVLGPHLRQKGQELLWRCSKHEDHDPSLRVNRAKNCWMCGPCGRAGNAWKLAAFLSGLDPNDKPAIKKWLCERGLLADSGGASHSRQPVRVHDLAHDKGLPTDFLLGLGLTNCANGVQITYRLTDGALAPRQRVRTALAAKKGSSWTTGIGELVPYGLWRLEEARKAGFLVVPEGESDSWTLWYHGFPALGLPGANMSAKLQLEYLDGIDRVFVIQEPDEGGKAFVTAIARRLRDIRWDGDLRYVVIPNAKDPNELHRQDPGGFQHVFRRALDDAESLPEVASTAEDVESSRRSLPYRSTPLGLLWLKPTRDGETSLPLTNFAARIVADIAEDDGVEVRHLLEIETVLRGRTRHFSVAASQFPTMNWVLENLGAGAIIYPGVSVKDNARAAIQFVSGDIPEGHAYKHLGWRKVGAVWVYLHAGGAIGAQGPVAGILVSLDNNLTRFALPEPPSGDALIRCVEASLRLLSVAPLRVTCPAYAAIWRAVLGPADFSLHFVGETGRGKTELVTLVQQHYGATMDARNLPASWRSTGNALEGLAFQAKDALLVVDDFAPTGNTFDIQRYHRDADALLRAQGNNSGRQRMRSDATLRPTKPPRGLLVSTGEDVPKGQSLRARMLVVELEPTDMQWDTLTLCQKDAAGGLYPQALAAYLRWLAPRYEELRDRFRTEVVNLRDKTVDSDGHRRVPEILANLGVALRYWFDFVREVGVLTREEADAQWQDCWNALVEAAGAQSKHQTASDPVRRFLELLRSAIGSGRAHVAAENGGAPESPQSWGWREFELGLGENLRQEWRPQGSRVGWIKKDGLFLDPDAALAAAQVMGRDLGDGIAVTPRTLHKRLSERGFLITTDEQRGTLTVRRTLEGARRDVLHLAADLAVEERGKLTALPVGDCAPVSDRDKCGCKRGLQPIGQFGQFSNGGRGDTADSVADPHPPPPKPDLTDQSILASATVVVDGNGTSGGLLHESDQPDQPDQVYEEGEF